MAAKVKKGDRVVVLAGRDKGKQGEVLKVLPDENRVVVQGVMIVAPAPEGRARAIRKAGSSPKEAPIAVSNVAHLDPKDGKPTRVGFKFLEDGRKVRFAKRSGEIIDR